MSKPIVCRDCPHWHREKTEKDWPWDSPWGDCTTPYEGEFKKPMEVEELVSLALDRADDWGYIGIKDNETIFGNPCCEYHKGKLLSELPREIMGRRIERIQIDAGWTRTDYLLTLEEEEDEC